MSKIKRPRPAEFDEETDPTAIANADTVYPAPPAASPETEGRASIVADGDGLVVSLPETQFPARTAGRRVFVELSLGPKPGPDDYMTDHLEVRLLTPQQRLGLRHLWTGADAAGLRLEDGRRLARPGDAIRWLLEQIAAAGQLSDGSGA